MAKQWTDEERQAFAAKMKASREKAKQAKKVPVEKPEPVQASSDNADIGELLKRIEELEKARNASADFGPQVNPRGHLVGTFEKYITDPDYYPNPVERLAKESRLQRFAFSDNFELDFGIGLSAYETKDGINTKEPKFTLKLINVVYDEDTGEPTDKRYVSCQMIFHEDPGTALVVARDNGVKVDDYSGGEKEFLDEMRYLRMRDWLLECFYPPVPVKATDKKEMVIGNRLVEVYTVNSEKSESMAGFFAGAPKKL